MEQRNILNVTVDGQARTYPAGTSYGDIAADVRARYDHDILLVNREGKLCELHKKLDRDCALHMVTAAEKPGMQTYERSVVLLMLKAFHDTVGAENVERITVEYSLS